MIVSDVFNDAKEAIGLCNETKVFSRLDDAIEALANKGQWDPLLVYVTIVSSINDIITLPSNVEVPLRINIGGHPAFPRSKLYEFTINGPGSNDPRVGWSWEDRGDLSNGQRLIKVSQTAPSYRVLARLKTAKITSMDQFIPLHSKLAIVLMLKSLECYRRGSAEDFQLGQGFEAQALKFLSEEQSSRNAFLEISKEIDHPQIRGYNYHANDIIVVSDVFDEASEICGGVGTEFVFDRISEAVEVLANKGQWDAMIAYLDIEVSHEIGVGTASGALNVVALPDQVEIPLKININRKPSLPRGRVWEFSCNGPGSDMDEVTTFTWVDQGDVATIIPLPFLSTVSVLGTAADQGKKITIQGTSETNEPIEVTITIGVNPIPTTDPKIFKTITRISKEITQAHVEILGAYKSLALLQPQQTESRYRQIKLLKDATEVKIMFRKSSLRVASLSDLIPLKSRQAILLMLRSLQLLRSPDLATNPNTMAASAALEAQALKFLQEEEQTRMGYMQVSAKEQLPAIGVNTNHRDVVIAGDVYDDAADIFGPIGRQRLFDKLTDSMEFLANKSQWDGMDGYVDVIADNLGYVTLPRQAEVPIGMNFYRTPTQMRSKWYEFHLNGMGTQDICGEYWDDLGEYPLIREPYGPHQLFAVATYPLDTDASLWVYGYDGAGVWIRSNGSDGKLVDGERVPITIQTTTDTFNPPATINKTFHAFGQVTRVLKSVTQGHVMLWEYIPIPSTPPSVTTTGSTTSNLLGYYDHDETDPAYRRLRIPKWATWARMRYRKNLMKITSMNDPLNLKSKTALTLAMRAVNALDKGDLNSAEGYEAKALKLIGEENQSRNPAESFSLQYDRKTAWADNLQGQY